VAGRLVERVDLVAPARGVGGKQPVELLDRGAAPDLADDALPVRLAGVDARPRDTERGNLDDGDGDGNLLAGGRGTLTVIDHERVGPPDLLAGKPLDGGGFRARGPRTDPGDRPGGTGTGGVGERSSPGTMSGHVSIGGPASGGDGG